MDRKRWAQIITVAVIVLGAVGTATEMFPVPVREWALWSASVVTAVAAALGFNTGEQPPRDTLPLYKRTPPPLPLLALCLVPLLGACGLTQQQRIQTARDAACAASVSTLEAVEVAAPLCDSEQCLDRLDKARLAAMQAAALACEERS